ncbi:lipase 3-like [Belonocnema kinseyi]|uniref:lipase 3-like n=1 Tax=Belonocnema kinseyi TaxID=2817044 RepID=UPI00143D187C|nr:lipase 3-like [Belonocnema kinseyi]
MIDCIISDHVRFLRFAYETRNYSLAPAPSKITFDLIENSVTPLPPFLALIVLDDASILAGLLSYFPAGCSTKQLLHFGFGFENPNTFRQYDYGVAKNLLKYKSVTPPEYPLEKVTVPVAVCYRTNDFLVDPKDISLLENRLKNIVRVSICNASLNHFDFNYGSNIRMEAYNDALKLMEGY